MFLTVTGIVFSVAVLAVIGAALGALIAVAAKFLAVEEDPRIEQVTSMLPGANCGACGYPGCPGMANAIVTEGADPKNCKPGKAEMVAAIKEYLKKYEEEHKVQE